MLQYFPMGWEFWIDRGGTFTDVVTRQPDGTLAVHKLLSADPRYADPAIAGIRQLLAIPAEIPLPADQIDVVRLGTTVATNARRGPGRQVSNWGPWFVGS